ncbi:MAG: DNA polymerase III subunit delta [Candidatus Polarisedimenticolia bacterium]
MPAALSFARFEESLRRGEPGPVYLLEGAEPFFHDEGVRLLETAVFGAAGSGGMNRDLLRGDEVDLAVVLERADTYPMGGGRRLVLVRGANGLRLQDPAPLAAYLARPNPRTCLVFSDPEFDRRRILYRTLLGGATRVDCGPLEGGAPAAWVRARLQRSGYGMPPELAEAVAVSLGGAGLARIDAELSKLMSAIGTPRGVTVADLGILAEVPRVEDAFRVAAQIVRGERGEAVAAVRALLREGEEPLRLLGAFAWYFRNLLRALAASGRRLPPRETTVLYGMDPGRMARFRAEAGTASAAVLREALRLCLQMDGELKGLGSRDPAHAFERLIHRVARRAGRAA